MPESTPSSSPSPSPAPAETTGATSPAPAAWYAGKVDADVVGHWTNKGYDITDPVKVATALTQAHREAEKFIGAPADKILRIPDPKDESGTKAFWQKLGAPADAKDYDLTAVTDVKLQETLRTAAAGARLPKDAASAIASALVKHQAEAATLAEAEKATKLEAERQDLTRIWGTNFEANKLVAQNAARVLGIDPEVVNTLEGVVGYAKVMEMFRSIGSKIGEDKFVSGGGATPGIMTLGQAQARKKELMSDTGWGKKYMDGDAVAVREMTALNMIIAAALDEEFSGRRVA